MLFLIFSVSNTISSGSSFSSHPVSYINFSKFLKGRLKKSFPELTGWKHKVWLHGMTFRLISVTRVNWRWISHLRICKTLVKRSISVLSSIKDTKETKNFYCFLRLFWHRLLYRADLIFLIYHLVNSIYILSNTSRFTSS